MLLNRLALRHGPYEADDTPRRLSMTDDYQLPIETGSPACPLSNIQLANALKLKGYDFHFRFGSGHHNLAQASLGLPESLGWLWRDYDPERTEQTFEQEEAESAKPVFRVRIANRDAW